MNDSELTSSARLMKQVVRESDEVVVVVEGDNNSKLSVQERRVVAVLVYRQIIQNIASVSARQPT